MKTRILTGVIAGALFLTVLLLPWSIVLTIATSLIAVIAVYEIFSVTSMLKHNGLESLALAFAALAPFFSRMSAAAVGTTCVMYAVLLAGTMLLYRSEISVKKAAAVFGLATLVSLSLACLSYLRTVSTRDSDGLFYVILALLMAWMTDTGAYFVGTFFGKHKLCPKLSPKKTVEGLIGGIAVALIVSALAAWVYQIAVLKTSDSISYTSVLVLTLVCAPLSVVGDLFASLIKRVCGVKDFGKIFPGHGGMLDRFDSLLFVLPAVYAAAHYMPLI
ncbi:MAG: CDP-archaeol synthase [Clostridia bacterium]|nr:CDP-archaeol synthase [Clostridia bacterium]